MKKQMIALVIALVASTAQAGFPPPNDEPGTDKNVLPEEMTVFLAETYEIGPWPDNVISTEMDKAGIGNRDWIVDKETGLKICRRAYIYINDKAAGGVTPGMSKEEASSVVDAAGLSSHQVIPLHPDATRPYVCSVMGMMAPEPIPGSKWYKYKVACPMRVLDDNGKTVFKDPPCPHDCNCVDEPVKM